MNDTRPRLLVALAATALVVTACATGGASPPSGSGDGDVVAGPGIDAQAKTITIGNIAALSGPAAVLNEPLVAGLQTYWDASNADGALDGWTVELDVKDSAYQAQQHVQQYNQIKDGIAMLGSFGASPTKAILSQIERDQIVTTPQSFDSPWGANELLAPLWTPFALDVLNIVDYVTDAGAKDLRIGLIYQNDEAGADSVRGYEAARSAYGFDDAGQEPFKPGDTDFTAQVQRMKSQGADVVYIQALPGPAASIIGAGATLGYEPQWIISGPAFVENLMTEDGVAGSAPTPIAAALDGVLVTMFAAPWGDPAVPGMEQMLADQAEYAPDQPPSVYFTFGYAQAKVQAAILAKAIASGDLSRAGILAAKTSLGDVDLQGLVPDVTYGGEADFPSRASLIQAIDATQPGFLRTVEPSFLGTGAESYRLG